jgi:hypothetical protein
MRSQDPIAPMGSIFVFLVIINFGYSISTLISPSPLSFRLTMICPFAPLAHCDYTG